MLRVSLIVLNRFLFMNSLILTHYLSIILLLLFIYHICLLMHDFAPAAYSWGHTSPASPTSPPLLLLLPNRVKVFRILCGSLSGLSATSVGALGELLQSQFL